MPLQLPAPLWSAMRETLKTASAPAKAIITVMVCLWIIIALLSIDERNPAWSGLAEAWLGVERLFRF